MEITKKNIIYASIIMLISTVIFFGGYFTGSHTGKDTAPVAAVKIENNIQQTSTGIDDVKSGITSTTGTIETVQSAIGSSQQSVTTVSEGLGNIADESEKNTGKIDDCIELAKQLDNGISDLQTKYGKNNITTENNN